MKIKFILIIILLLLNISCCKITSQENINIKHSQSKALIERYNKLRVQNKVPTIIQDTILDNICSVLITNNKYRNKDNAFNEDSIRHLLYRNGVIDYQYNIQETLDNDTIASFNSFLLSDNSSNLHVGYKKKRAYTYIIQNKELSEI